MEKKVLTSAIAVALGLVSSGAIIAEDNSNETGKCYGVAKAGENDCGSKPAGHSCGGKAKRDYDPNDFKVMVKGDCEKDPHHERWEAKK